MSDRHQPFIHHLEWLAKNNLGAIARLRRSLTFTPGAALGTFAYVERFLPDDENPDSPNRLAHYLLAGLFALHLRQQDNKPDEEKSAPATPTDAKQQDDTLAKSMGSLYYKLEQSPSIERRFTALLESDAETLHEPLRQCVSLLRAHNLDIDFLSLLTDLTIWLNPHRRSELDRLRRRWACDFYRSKATTDSND